MTGWSKYRGWNAMTLSVATGKIGIHQLSCAIGAEYQVSRWGWNAYAMPVVR